MNKEGKATIAKYMKWRQPFLLTLGEDDYYTEDAERMIHFNLNDASLCVQEMQQRGEWEEFIIYADDYHFNREINIEFSAWLMTMTNSVAENFFSALAEYLKQKEKEG